MHAARGAALLRVELALCWQLCYIMTEVLSSNTPAANARELNVLQHITKCEREPVDGKTWSYLP